MLFILIILALMIPVFVFLGQSINMYFRKLQDKLGQSNAIVNEVLHNIYTVKAFTNELFEIERYEKTLQSLAKSYLKAIKLKSYFNVIFTLLSLGCIVSVIWYNAILIKKGHVSAGSLLSSVLYINLVSKAIAGLGIAWGDLQRALGASHRILQIIQEKEEVNLIEKYKEHSHTLKGEIQFREVNFSYPTREGIKVLHNINFSIKAGEKVAFVGPSGVGKSTITQLIMGFYNTQKGTIKIDKKDIQEYNISFLRKNIGIVPQDIVVFNGTIRENIAYGKPGATEEEIVDAAQKGNLLTFIKTLPNEFDTVIGEKGITLSGGQRQRIAIARTILKSPSILILDEATSSLDSVSEIEVREALEEIMIGRTTILITHQLSNIYNMDRIYTLKQGRIIKVSSTKEIKGASAICI
jgi:ABC-type multidrug transport system fused ATPase/permease subunit